MLPPHRALLGCCLLATACRAAASSTAPPPRVVVFEATGGGFAAAVAAAQAGADVTLIAAAGSGGGNGAHIGGMVTGGLQHTDCGNASTIGGLALAFFTRVEQQYPNRSTSPNLGPITGPPCWMFEAHVAEAVMWGLLREASVRVVLEAQGVAAVEVAAGVVKAITTLAGDTFEGDVFIDASYEGDAAAAAGASMVVGREPAAQYNESDGGRRPVIDYDQFGPHIWPYWGATAASPLLPLIDGGDPGEPGDGDAKVEAYTYRLCMTRAPSARLPVAAPPPGYNASDYELFRRLFAVAPPTGLGSVLACLGPIPNIYLDCPPGSNTNASWAARNGGWCKCDMIGAGALNTDMAQGAWDYPAASVPQRRAIALAHAHYAWGVLWFLAHDPAVPAAVRTQMADYGLCGDEFSDGVPLRGWPHQLYVREARRLVGDFVFTQNDPPPALAARSIGLGSYAFDAHVVQRVVHHADDGSGQAWVVNEGEILRQPPCYQPPYRIPYDALLPRRSQLTNLLVPVALSASHVRFTSLRMEPTWMITGQAAGVAAALAATSPTAPGNVHAVDIAQLQAALRIQGAILEP